MRLYTLGDRFNLCGERVREARMRMGWSQEELAAKLQLAGLQLGQMAVTELKPASAWCRTLSCRYWPRCCA